MFTPAELRLVVRIVREEIYGKGGYQRAQKLSQKRRQEIASNAGRARWEKEREKRLGAADGKGWRGLTKRKTA